MAGVYDDSVTLQKDSQRAGWLGVECHQLHGVSYVHQ